jgi:SAM-dependent methyltransferase
MNDGFVSQLFGRDLLHMTSPIRERWIGGAFRYWRAKGFPYPRLDDNEIKREFALVRRSFTGEVFAGGFLKTATTGLRLANFFHPQMWHTRSQQHRSAPIDYFNDDVRLRQLLARAPGFWPNRRCWNAQCVRSLFRIYSSGRVANFRPLVARAIMDRYSPSRGNVVDFCAGFGGRLLASLTLERHYIGVDASRLQVQGLKNMVRTLKEFSVGSAELHKASAEDFLPTVPSRSIDLVFSSPPFFDTELYGFDSTQSAVRYPNYPDWIDAFLHVIILEAHRILKPGGFFVINVADKRRLPLKSDTLRFAVPIFGAPRMLRMVMHSRPLQRSKRVENFRWEPVFVFKRR